MTPPSTAAARARPRRRDATAPAAPRRVSGRARPERGPLRRARAVAAASVAAPAPTVPGIALPRRRPGPRAAPRAPLAPGRLLGALAALPDARLLDRLIRGRLWIGLVAFALIGIVAMQLMLLKLNTGIGHAIEHEQLLQRQNASLEIAVSGAAAPDRVELQAQRLGMSPAAPGAIQFLSGSGSALTVGRREGARDRGAARARPAPPRPARAGADGRRRHPGHERGAHERRHGRGRDERDRHGRLRHDRGLGDVADRPGHVRRGDGHGAGTAPGPASARPERRARPAHPARPAAPRRGGRRERDGDRRLGRRHERVRRAERGRGQPVAPAPPACRAARRRVVSR